MSAKLGGFPERNNPTQQRKHSTNEYFMNISKLFKTDFGFPISGRTRASAAVQGDRPTVRPKQVLAESRGYPPRVISGRREYLRCPQIPRNLKSEIPFFFTAVLRAAYRTCASGLR